MPITNKLFVIAFCLLFSYPILAQNTKGMYVNDFKNIIGDTAKETELLTYAQQEGFNYLLLYNMYWIHKYNFNLTDPVAAQPLADFIERAKTEFGILEVGAVGEKRSSFDKLVAYQENFSDNPNQLFDVFNIEFEFWNNNVVTGVYCDHYLEDAGLPCTNTGAFKFYIKEMKALHELCNSLGIQSETYIGKLKANQGKALGKTCDRVLVHYYRKSDTYSNGNSLYNFKAERLEMLAPKNGKLKVLPIFAATSAFMGPWLTEHSTDAAFDTYMDGQLGYNATNGAWKDHIDIDGFQWYGYTHLLEHTNLTNTPIGFQNNNNNLPDTRNHNQLNHDHYNDTAASPPTTLQAENPDQLGAEPSGVFLYPNPVDDLLRIQCPANASLYMMNIRGEVLKELSVNEKKEIDVSDFENGVYFISVDIGKEMFVRKVVVN